MAIMLDIRISGQQNLEELETIIGILKDFDTTHPEYTIVVKVS